MQSLSYILCTNVFVSGRLIDDVDIAVGTRQLLASLLQMSLLSDDLISACVHDPDASFANLVRDHERFSDSLLVVMAKCVCRFAYSILRLGELPCADCSALGCIGFSPVHFPN